VTDVDVLILHPTPADRADEIETWVADARAALAERHRIAFQAAGAARSTIVAGPPDGRTFGARLATFMAERRPAGLVVLGSGAIPLATSADRRAFVSAAASGARVALANNRFSADIVAIARVAELPRIPELRTDNELPRWLAEEAGWDVADRHVRWRLGVDIDGPLELALIGGRSWLPAPPREAVDLVGDRLRGVRVVAADARAELVVTGRISATDLRWLERSTASRTRALVEERGMRTRIPGQRPAASAVGMLLDREGPAALGRVLARLGDAALVDSRVLLAHHCGTDERTWPRATDRFASDLLLPDRIGDAWLRDLTTAARDAPIPILLGGHSLVGPGLRLALGKRMRWT
jgi:hypothetical protein